MIRYSNFYKIVGVIDGRYSGKDSGVVLKGKQNNIPIFGSLEDALEFLEKKPKYLIYGKSPLGKNIPIDDRNVLLDAMKEGLNLVNGLHQFLSEDPEFLSVSVQNSVTIKDYRKPPSVDELNVYSGKRNQIPIPIIAVLGTDCATGKMTTALELDHALNNLGINSVFIATGQTSLMQGAKYGVCIDSLVSQFVIGEIEFALSKAYEEEKPDIMIVEGQGALSHPAFLSTIAILKGAKPDGIILQHAPGRNYRCDFPSIPMPELANEIQLIESISNSMILSITLNHENLNADEIQQYIQGYEVLFDVPVCDIFSEEWTPMSRGCKKIISQLIQHFPKLEKGQRKKGA